jgi:hypothetical protein
MWANEFQLRRKLGRVNSQNPSICVGISLLMAGYERGQVWRFERSYISACQKINFVFIRNLKIRCKSIDTILYASLICLSRAVWPAHIILYLITITKLGEE